MGTKETKRINHYYVRLRERLLKKFGGVCEICQSQIMDELQFAHRIGFRWLYGPSRGRNARIQNVKNHPERYFLACPSCHAFYDKDNPLTQEEIEISERLKAETTPF